MHFSLILIITKVTMDLQMDRPQYFLQVNFEII